MRTPGLRGVPARRAVEPGFARAAVAAGPAPGRQIAAGLRTTVRERCAGSPPGVLSGACKGFEAGTGKLPHEIVAEVRRRASGVLRGPSFAAEVARPARGDRALRARRRLRPPLGGRAAPAAPHLLANTDLVGCEVGGAVKNVMAIAAESPTTGLAQRAPRRSPASRRDCPPSARALGARQRPDGLAGMGDLIHLHRRPRA